MKWRLLAWWNSFSYPFLVLWGRDCISYLFLRFEMLQRDRQLIFILPEEYGLEGGGQAFYGQILFFLTGVINGWNKNKCIYTWMVCTFFFLGNFILQNWLQTAFVLSWIIFFTKTTYYGIAVRVIELASAIASPSCLGIVNDGVWLKLLETNNGANLGWISC